MVYVIAEVASAHDGDKEQLYSLIRAAHESGADAIKFQIYNADTLSVRSYRYHKLYKKLQYTM